MCLLHMTQKHLETQIHDLDYSALLLGMPHELYAVGGKNSSLEIDVEDSVQILMKIIQISSSFLLSAIFLLFRVGLKGCQSSLPFLMYSI